LYINLDLLSTYCDNIFSENNLNILSLTLIVAHHSKGVYRPGKSGGDSENTPDTKLVEWAATGRKRGTCGKSKKIK